METYMVLESSQATDVTMVPGGRAVHWTSMAPKAAEPSDTNMAPVYILSPDIGMVFNGLRNHKH